MHGWFELHWMRTVGDIHALWYWELPETRVHRTTSHTIQIHGWWGWLDTLCYPQRHDTWWLKPVQEWLSWLSWECTWMFWSREYHDFRLCIWRGSCYIDEWCITWRPSPVSIAPDYACNLRLQLCCKSTAISDSRSSIVQSSFGSTEIFYQSVSLRSNDFLFLMAVMMCFPEMIIMWWDRV